MSEPATTSAPAAGESARFLVEEREGRLVFTARRPDLLVWARVGSIALLFAWPLVALVLDPLGAMLGLLAIATLVILTGLLSSSARARRGVITPVARELVIDLGVSGDYRGRSPPEVSVDGRRIDRARVRRVQVTRRDRPENPPLHCVNLVLDDEVIFVEGFEAEESALGLAARLRDALAHEASDEAITDEQIAPGCSKVLLASLAILVEIALITLGILGTFASLPEAMTSLPLMGVTLGASVGVLLVEVIAQRVMGLLDRAITKEQARATFGITPR